MRHACPDPPLASAGVVLRHPAADDIPWITAACATHLAKAASLSTSSSAVKTAALSSESETGDAGSSTASFPVLGGSSSSRRRSHHRSARVASHETRQAHSAPAIPSATDLRLAFYPDALYLLVSLDPDEADPVTGRVRERIAPTGGIDDVVRRRGDIADRDPGGVVVEGSEGLHVCHSAPQVIDRPRPSVPSDRPGNICS